MDPAGKVVVVTGGANGIGKALCERFHAAGAARIVVADVNIGGAEETAQMITDSGGEAHACRADVVDASSLAPHVRSNLCHVFGRLLATPCQHHHLPTPAARSAAAA